MNAPLYNFHLNLKFITSNHATLLRVIFICEEIDFSVGRLLFYILSLENFSFLYILIDRDRNRRLQVVMFEAPFGSGIGQVQSGLVSIIDRKRGGGSVGNRSSNDRQADLDTVLRTLASVALYCKMRLARVRSLV